MNCDLGGDLVEEVIQAIKLEHDFDVFHLISPYTPQSILSMMTLLANGGNFHEVDDTIRANAANAINYDFNLVTIGTIVESENAKRYLRTVIGHAKNIVESVQGFAGGQVVRACNGYNFSTVNTAERFMAQININRWIV